MDPLARKEVVMRRFLVGSCCVIVALQLLIGLPLAVCIGFLSMIPHRSFDVHMDGGYVEPSMVGYSPVPVTYAPSPCTTSCPSSYPTYDAPTTPPIVSPSVAAPMIPNSLVAASPVLSGEQSSVETADEYIAAFKQVAEEDALIPAPPASETEASCHCENALVDSLSTAVTHLYELARNLEADGSYGQADHIRDLARKIREEINIINITRGERASPVEPQAATAAITPPTVTEAPPFNPEPASP
jgi:hypothetical protein